MKIVGVHFSPSLSLLIINWKPKTRHRELESERERDTKVGGEFMMLAKCYTSNDDLSLLVAKHPEAGQIDKSRG